MKELTLKKSNIVIGCIYKHPNRDVPDFKNNCLNQIFEIVSKEQKEVYSSFWRLSYKSSELQ